MSMRTHEPTKEWEMNEYTFLLKYNERKYMFTNVYEQKKNKTTVKIYFLVIWEYSSMNQNDHAAMILRCKKKKEKHSPTMS